MNSIGQGTFVEPSRLTVSDWMDTWLKEYKKPSVRATTFESYEYLTRVHIKPSIGHICLKDLRPHHLQKLYNDKLENGRVGADERISAKTAKNMHNVIHASFDQAVKNNLVVRNVSEATTLPKYTKREMRVLAIDEQLRLLKVLEDERLRCAFILALGTGIREGELLALRWIDIDLKQGIVNINRTVRRTNNFDKNAETKTSIMYQEPKTKSGRRSIPLPESVIKELKVHQERQEEDKKLQEWSMRKMI